MDEIKRRFKTPAPICCCFDRVNRKIWAYDCMTVGACQSKRGDQELKETCGLPQCPGMTPAGLPRATQAQVLRGHAAPL